VLTLGGFEMTLIEYEQLVTPPEWVRMSEMSFKPGDLFKFQGNSEDVFVVIENGKFHIQRTTRTYSCSLVWSLSDYVYEKVKLMGQVEWG
jgi:hypothetical protein